VDALIRSVLSRASTAYQSAHKGSHPPEKTLFRMLFKLLTAKVLKDMGIIRTIDLGDPWEAMRLVDDKFPPSEPLGPIDDAVLYPAANEIGSAFPFSNISVDTLAYVYENTLVSTSLRKQLSVYHTPSCLASYIVNRLPLGDVPHDDIRVVDPMCGSGVFLVAALRRLRTLLSGEWKPESRHRYFTRHLTGRDIDPFAVEVARLTLTLADLPNPDGWDVAEADAFRSGALEEWAGSATVFLTNPPFEAFGMGEAGGERTQAVKAAEMLVRVLPALPMNALVGVVMPLSFLDGRSYRAARETLAQECEVLEFLRLPDRIFERSDAESVVVLARKRQPLVPRYDISYRGVSERGRDAFVRTGVVTRDDVIPAQRVLGDAAHISVTFWVPRAFNVWDSLAALPTLGQVAEVHRGVEYQGGGLSAERGKTVRDTPFTGAVRGIDSVKRQLLPFLIQNAHWLGTEERLRRRHAWELPWDKPKVIVNASPHSRGSWRLMAARDTQGLLATSRFHGVWPHDPSLAPLLVAMLNGPLANAFVYDHEGKRVNRKSTLVRIPLPPLDPNMLAAIGELVGECERRTSRDPALDLSDLLLGMDAQLLDAYDLAPRDERRILDMFWDEERPGCTTFKGYYSPEFAPTIPLHVYLSKEYSDSRADRTLSRLPVVDDPLVSQMLRELLEIP
jgi:hypothetical protein